VADEVFQRRAEAAGITVQPVGEELQHLRSSAASLAFRVTAAMESPPGRCRVCSLPGWSSWFLASVGLEPADRTGAVSGHGGDQLAVLVDDAQAGVAELNGDNLAGVGEADLDALPGDLDAAAAGDLPLDGLVAG
jgi:hypothetical protein